MVDSEPTLMVMPVFSVFRPEEFNTTTISCILVVIVLLFLSGIISGSETAFFSILPADIERIKNSKSRRSSIVINLLNNPEMLLATLLIISTVLNVSIVIISFFVISSIFNLFNFHVLGFVIYIGVITLIILYLCIIPSKVYASRHACSFALAIAPLLNILQKLFYPFSKFLVNNTNINNQIIKKNSGISIEQLSHALDLTEGSSSEEKSILKGIVKFGNIYVSEIMRPRVDVIAVDINLPYHDLLKVVNDSGYSRIPVYSGAFDDNMGILYIKDLLLNIDKPTNYKWQPLIRPSYFIPESKKINDLLKEFQLKHIHMAVVVDEYGGISGIVTLEDILEEIVGEIADESDIEEKWYKKIDNNTFLVQGKALLDDLCPVIQVDENVFDEVKGDAETLAGLILEIGGELPKKNAILTYKDFIFEIKEVDTRRIILIQVTIKRNL